MNLKCTVMRKLFFTLLLLVGGISANAQNMKSDAPQSVQIGDKFEIGSPNSSTFKHVDFPRLNFIVKRGGIASYKRVEGQKVVVTSVNEMKDGTLRVKIKRADGGRFFGSHTVVSADINEALASGELQRI